MKISIFGYTEKALSKKVDCNAIIIEPWKNKKTLNILNLLKNRFENELKKDVYITLMSFVEIIYREKLLIDLIDSCAFKIIKKDHNMISQTLWYVVIKNGNVTFTSYSYNWS